MESVKHFLTSSYKSDKIAFYNEMVSLVFTVAASLYIAIYAQDPDMRIAYPLFLVGSIAGTYAYYRRHLVLSFMLTKYFFVINIFGFGRAMTWW
jgi:hypothetical protein